MQPQLHVGLAANKLCHALRPLAGGRRQRRAVNSLLCLISALQSATNPNALASLGTRHPQAQGAVLQAVPCLVPASSSLLGSCSCREGPYPVPRSFARARQQLVLRSPCTLTTQPFSLPVFQVRESSSPAPTAAICYSARTRRLQGNPFHAFSAGCAAEGQDTPSGVSCSVPPHKKVAAEGMGATVAGSCGLPEAGHAINWNWPQRSQAMCWLPALPHGSMAGGRESPPCIVSPSSVGAEPELCCGTSPPTCCPDGSVSDASQGSLGTKGITGSREVGYKCCDGSQAHAVTGIPFLSLRMTLLLGGSWSQTQHGMERPGPVGMGRCVAHGFPGHRWDCAPTQLRSTAGTLLGYCCCAVPWLSPI